MNKKASKENTAAAAANVRGENIHWFLPYWNQQRKEKGSRLCHLTFLTQKQETMLKYRQAVYGPEALRQFVLNLMTSDYVNGRRGKFAPTHIDYYLHKDRFPMVVQGKYNDLSPEERPETEEERRKREAEQRAAEREEQRRRWRDEEEAERERRAKQREEWARGAVTYEEYLRMKDNLN